MSSVIVRKAVIGLLASSALALASTEASATLVSFNGGPAGASASVNEDVSLTSWSFVFGQNLGWNHTTNVTDLHVTDGAGPVAITASQNAATDAFPAFSIWSRTSGTGLATGSHQFNQVTGPTGTNAFMAAAGIDGIVGYGNAGAPFTNADGNDIGHGGALGAFSGSFVNGVSNGLAYVTLTLDNLAEGTYLIYHGGSDFNNTSGATTGGQTLTASVVPIPAAVWLFGSALAGMGVIGRRRVA